MDINYEQVPYIITGKDLDYLSDMFTWNCDAYKKTKNCLGQIQRQDIMKMVEQANTVFLENTNEVLAILKGGNNE